MCVQSDRDQTGGTHKVHHQQTHATTWRYQSCLALLDSAPWTESTSAERICANIGGEIIAAARRIFNGYLSFLTEFDGNRSTKAAIDNSTNFTVAAICHCATMETATAALVSSMEVVEEARTRSFWWSHRQRQMAHPDDMGTRLEFSVELFTTGWLAGVELTVGATRSRPSWSTGTPNCGGEPDTAPRPGRPGCRDPGPSRADRCSVWRDGVRRSASRWNVKRGHRYVAELFSSLFEEDKTNCSSKWWHC